MNRSTPEYCGFDCLHSAFPPPETAGICRTMAAVWCRKLRELVDKNALCEWRRRAAAPPGAKRSRRRKADS